MFAGDFLYVASDVQIFAVDLNTQQQALTLALGQMGDSVAVRLGVTRPFAPQEGPGRTPGLCWLMADGFFSLTDPQS